MLAATHDPNGLHSKVPVTQCWTCTFPRYRRSVRRDETTAKCLHTAALFKPEDVDPLFDVHVESVADVCRALLIMRLASDRPTSANVKYHWLMGRRRELEVLGNCLRSVFGNVGIVQYCTSILHLTLKALLCSLF